MKNNLQRKAKNLWTDNDQGSHISYYRAVTEQDEAYFVAKKIREEVQKNERVIIVNLLYYTGRMHSPVLSRRFFLKSGIPYKNRWRHKVL
ncbi:hypothetical protein GCM10020331_015810 [Ectobacillus funiculus]